MSLIASPAVKKLTDFGYGFKGKNNYYFDRVTLISWQPLPDGLLYQVDKDTLQLTDKRFDFNLYPEHSKNQKHYEALGEVSAEYPTDSPQPTLFNPPFSR